MSKERFKPLTSQQVKLLKITFRKMDTTSLAKRFYATLFERAPSVIPLFPADKSELATKLISVFELVVFSFVETAPDVYQLQKDVLLPLKTLGQKHNDKGVDHSHYPLANEILLHCMKEELGKEFSSEAEEAWKLALNHLTTAMLSKEVSAPSTPLTLRDTFQYIKSILFKSE